ncbi:MAG TPA: deoxyguanosinetriphosphate triphosphohydrolase [Bosea sp. (in: a-proteobacteria)]|jgi:dGTPase|uniref:deoxyguanosinetriphosphate triphosphohydrolase n=1 Tax=Bosea sp. (in: a-proteobacteria) TaxID=1871050 RepID=UPI002DDDB849|nr:deoxyguanosinetriphosphate triphosphohydrolase [Bosea sp. (in: a-proteobacteria)]HEV2552148.1 deoxyguanosinetriphosphate triphosphohydrolase [Bosea sp. (in: a-proteobacteria)]
MPHPLNPAFGEPDGREPGDRWRAPYACRAATSRGRLIAEPASPTRNPFQRDRDRIIHSTAFRRLKHKTQVFVSHEGDHFRTRLTHTIEVAQIARALARALGLDEDLAEALALAHDLGHTPFGHTGEDALAECMADVGGFDHNAQTLRIVTRLERRYAGFDGLNLTWETLEGLVKHNGPLLTADGSPTERYEQGGIPAAIVEYQAKQDLWLDSYASAEAQAAALADDIAYNAHDIDDGLRAGLFGHGELRAVPFLAELLDEIEGLHPGLETARATNELVRRVITRFVEGVIAESQGRLAVLAPADADAVRRAGRPVIAFPNAITRADAEIKAFLYPNMYRHARIAPIRREAAQVVRDLFGRFRANPGLMPVDWAAGCESLDAQRLARRVADYIAGMTDWYALDEHRRLFDATPTLR